MLFKKNLLSFIYIFLSIHLISNCNLNFGPKRALSKLPSVKPSIDSTFLNEEIIENQNLIPDSEKPNFGPKRAFYKVSQAGIDPRFLNEKIIENQNSVPDPANPSLPTVIYPDDFFQDIIPEENIPTKKN